MRRVRECSVRPAGFCSSSLVSVAPRLFVGPRTKSKQKTSLRLRPEKDFFSGAALTWGKVADSFASAFPEVCAWRRRWRDCRGLAQKGSPDVGEKCRVNCSRKKESEEKPNAVYLRWMFVFPSGICERKATQSSIVFTERIQVQ